MSVDLELQIIAAGYRQLSKKLHPDHGGTAEQMIQLNAARDRLKALLYASMDNPSNQPGAVSNQHEAAPPAPTAAKEFLRQFREEVERNPIAGIVTILERLTRPAKRRGKVGQPKRRR